MKRQCSKLWQHIYIYIVKCRMVSMQCLVCDWHGNKLLLHYDKVKLELITVFLLSLSLWGKWINMTWLKCSTLRLVKQWHSDADKSGNSHTHTHTHARERESANAFWMFRQLRFLKCVLFRNPISLSLKFVIYGTFAEHYCSFRKLAFSQYKTSSLISVECSAK